MIDDLIGPNLNTFGVIHPSLICGTMTTKRKRNAKWRGVRITQMTNRLHKFLSQTFLEGAEVTEEKIAKHKHNLLKQFFLGVKIFLCLNYTVF